MAEKRTPDLTPPAGVAKAAERGLRLREKFGRGGTDVGVNRAHQLSKRQPVSEADIADISSYFARHAVDKDAKSTTWGDRENPSAGYIAWLLWGGDAGKRWADHKKRQLSR